LPVKKGETTMKNPDCTLQPWEAAQCPKLGSSFDQIVEKVTEVDSLLTSWASEPGLSHELRMRILNILGLVNEIPPMLGDIGFDHDGAMQYHSEVLEALKVPEISITNL
jgi:hypothetical protein